MFHVPIDEAAQRHAVSNGLQIVFRGASHEQNCLKGGRSKPEVWLQGRLTSLGVKKK